MPSKSQRNRNIPRLVDDDGPTLLRKDYLKSVGGVGERKKERVREERMIVERLLHVRRLPSRTLVWETGRVKGRMGWCSFVPFVIVRHSPLSLFLFLSCFLSLSSSLRVFPLSLSRLSVKNVPLFFVPSSPSLVPSPGLDILDSISPPFLSASFFLFLFFPLLDLQPFHLLF